MKNNFFHYLFLLISCIFSVSCTDDIYDSDIPDKQTNISANISDVIDYAKTQFISGKTKSVSGASLPQNEPQWNNYRIFKQSGDTVSLSIPIDSGTNGEQSMLIANQTGSKKQLFYVKLPGNKNDSLPLNIRRRIVVVKDGEKMLCRPVIDKDGRLRIARLRTTPELKSGTIDGGTLPEAVVYPGSDYDTWWWWWDYMAGIMTLPPPAGTPGGYPDPEPDPQRPPRPDYFKSENIMKDAGVKAAIWKMAENTKNDASKELGRRERGFWVFYDKTTNKYYTGKEILGEYFKGGEGTKGGEIKPGIPWTNNEHIPKSAEPVTFVHIHPPLSYENDNCKLTVGPSPADISYAEKNNVELIIIDYVGEKDRDGRYIIIGGHDVNDPMTEYYYKPAHWQ